MILQRLREGLLEEELLGGENTIDTIKYNALCYKYLTHVQL